MKSLNDEIREIVASNSSKSVKAQALKKLCITPYEIELLLSEPRTTVQGWLTPTRYTFTFGVEIECGVSRSRLAETAAQTGMAYEYQGYNHRDGHTFFKFVTDGSLNLPDAIECVSPVLKGAAGKAALKNALDTINRAGGTTNKSCGLHVHIGAATLTQEQYINTFINYQHLESLIDTFMAPSRRANANCYCKSLQRRNFSLCRSVRDVQNVLGHDRYHKVNPMSWNAHKTIEFRQHGGTTSYDKIMNWAQFCGKLVVWSRNNRLAEDITDIDQVPFLSAAEKRFFKGRVREFEDREAARQRRAV